jgi:DNA end-binding protein Ku
VPIADAEVREPELKLAKQLIDQIASETFDPTQYEDDVRKRTQADIDRKVKGQDIATAEPAPEPARIIDLMEALKASLGKKDGGGKDRAAAGAEGGDQAQADDRRSPRRSAPRPEKTETKRARGGKR